MDKYEYKVRADEIKALISEGEFAEAVSIADTIDWRRVKSVMMLCTISDLYKINRRYQESKDILLLAYEKHPTGRLIVYSLCELSIKLEEYVQAIEYYKEFSQIAPKDTGRYILQYRLYEAQDVSLEERIAVLEEFKRRDYREKWAYELAYLYHRIGLATKCVEECDEMFLWFGDGKYVIKALELKALHGPLSEEQQVKYEAWIRERDGIEQPEEDGDVDDVSGDTLVAGEFIHTGEDDSDIGKSTAAPTMELPEVKTVDLGQYNTINLQMALAESMKEILEEEALQETSEQGVEEVPESAESEIFPEDVEEIPESEEEFYPEDAGEISESEEEESYSEDVEAVLESEEEEFYPKNAEEVLESEEEELYPEDIEAVSESEEDDAFPEDKEAVEDIEETVQEISDPEEVRPDLEEDAEEGDSLVASLIAPLLEETVKMPSPEEVEEQLQAAPVIQFPERQIAEPQTEVDEEEPEQEEPQREEAEQTEPEVAADDVLSLDAQQIVEQLKQEAEEAVIASGSSQAAVARDDVLTPLNAKPSKYDSFLSQEYDGQISLVMPDAVRVEKQITGQLSIDDIMAEWEEMKRTSEQRRKEEVRRRILAHTGNLFADFDEATKNGLLEELERAFMEAIRKESERKAVFKKIISPEDDAEKNSALSVTKPDTELPAEDAELIEDVPEDDIGDEVDVPEDDIGGEVDVPEDDIGDEVEELEEIEEVAAEESLTTESGVDEEIEETAEEPEEPVHEAEAAETGVESVEESIQNNVQDRELTTEEQELFGQFTHHRKTRKQLIHTLDNMSLASYTGNVIITGEEETAALELAKALIKEMQLNDNNFSEKVAKISANVLNKKDVSETFARLNNGALIIEKAARLKPDTVAKMTKVLEKDNMGLLLIMIDKKQGINQLLADYAELNNNFNLRIDIEPLNNEALVAYAKRYAEDLEYSIDEFGILALHTRIAERQTSDHEVSMAEVRELVDEAIYYANKKTPKHFMDILLAKRYDEDDMIILREKDFMHY